jgi:hypothetical protein
MDIQQAAVSNDCGALFRQQCVWHTGRSFVDSVQAEIAAGGDLNKTTGHFVRRTQIHESGNATLTHEHMLTSDARTADFGSKHKKTPQTVV